MNQFIDNLKTLPYQELITIAYADSPKKAYGKDVIHGLGLYIYNIKSVLDLKYFERGKEYAFGYKADIKLIDVTDAKNQKVKVSALEKLTIENFFNAKLIFDIKKNF